MATRTPDVDDDSTERIVDIDVSSEMESSFLEYAYSVIYSRALPDARDGLKPVQRSSSTRTPSSTPGHCPTRATGSSPYSAGSCTRWTTWGSVQTVPM